MFTQGMLFAATATALWSFIGISVVGSLARLNAWGGEVAALGFFATWEFAPFILGYFYPALPFLPHWWFSPGTIGAFNPYEFGLILCFCAFLGMGMSALKWH